MKRTRSIAGLSQQVSQAGGPRGDDHRAERTRREVEEEKDRLAGRDKANFGQATRGTPKQRQEKQLERYSRYSPLFLSLSPWLPLSHRGDDRASPRRDEQYSITEDDLQPPTTGRRSVYRFLRAAATAIAPAIAIVHQPPPVVRRAPSGSAIGQDIRQHSLVGGRPPSRPITFLTLPAGEYAHPLHP